MVDVKLTGVAGLKRARNFFKPCKQCGWSNQCVDDFIDSEEKDKIKEMAKADQSILKSPLKGGYFGQLEDGDDEREFE